MKEPILSREEVETLAHRICFKYVHADSPAQRRYTFGMLTLEQFARAYEAELLEKLCGETSDWKLVPIEPVAAMQIPSYLPDVDWPTRKRIYRDMIAASPQRDSPDQSSASVGTSPPDWMACESRRPFVVNSIRARAEQLREAERLCRAAFTKEFMSIPAIYVADAYGEAARVLEARLAAIDDFRAQGDQS